MRLNMSGKYALLLVIYISRSGRVSTSIVAESLGLSKALFEQVARKLRIAGILNVRRGPGGGYELNNDRTITVGRVLSAVGVSPVQLETETVKNLMIGTEGRVLNFIIGSISQSINQVLSKPVMEFCANMIAEEINQLNSVDKATHV